MGRDINWIWPLHELKYGMGERDGSEKGNSKSETERNTDILLLYKGFPLSLRLSSSPFPISALSPRDGRARDEGGRS